MNESGSVESPRMVTPVFFGCFDWHSAVHAHWLLARVLRRFPNSDIAGECREILDGSLTVDGLRMESEYVSTRPTFERPYGLAWVLALASELEGTPWRDSIRPLELLAREHLCSWLGRLSYPVRTGTHNQTAFAMVLALEYSRSAGDVEFADFLVRRAIDFHGDDRAFSQHLEPSGEDFFSPSLSAAWLMSRVYDEPAFMSWLEEAMPTLGREFSFLPVTPADRSDGRIAHLDGLNLSRAWMLQDIAGRFSEDDPRGTPLRDSALAHRDVGLEGLLSPYYEGSHWLGTFAAYLETES